VNLLVPCDVAFFCTETVRLALPRRYDFAESRKDAPEITRDKADMMTAGLGQTNVIARGEGDDVGDGEMATSTDRAA
jgi:hypothetical protein